jgi:hypothetical protein
MVYRHSGTAPALSLTFNACKCQRNHSSTYSQNDSRIHSFLFLVRVFDSILFAGFNATEKKR